MAKISSVDVLNSLEGVENKIKSFSVDYGTSVVSYALNKDEYRGIIKCKRTGRECSITHFIKIRGQRKGYVGPPGATNRLAQKDPNVREDVPKEKYYAVIQRLILACCTAIKQRAEGAEFKEEELNVPKWISFEPGIMDNKEMLRAERAGVEEFIFDFAIITGQKILVDTKILLGSFPGLRKSKHIEVREGVWSDTAQEHLKNIRLPRRLKMLAVEDSLTLETPGVKTSTPLSAEGLKEGMMELARKFNHG